VLELKVNELAPVKYAYEENDKNNGNIRYVPNHRTWIIKK